MHALGTNMARTYIVDMAERFFPDTDLTKSSASFPASWTYTPADESLVAAWEEATATRPKAPESLVKKYGSLFGACLHASKYRPEILAAMGLLGSCLTFPTEQTYNCLVRVLVYLVRTKNLGVTFNANSETSSLLRARADSNWSEKRSTSGFVIFLADAAINSHSRRQHCITMSSCEAELVALAEVAIELIHVDGLLRHIGHSHDGPISAATDNKGAYDLCHRYTSAQNSRHIDRKLFKMRELRGAGVVSVELIPTESNPADLFTKILSRQTFEKHRRTVLNLSAVVSEGVVDTAAPERVVDASARDRVVDAAAAGSMVGNAPMVDPWAGVVRESVVDESLAAAWADALRNTSADDEALPSAPVAGSRGGSMSHVGRQMKPPRRRRRRRGRGGKRGG